MKSTLTLLVCALLAYTGRAATNVSGIITANTTWTKANSPYMVAASIAIDSNVTLTIEPGVEVRCAGKATIYCDGNIIAAGTVADPIVLTSSITGTHTLDDWQGIELRGKTKGLKSVFRNCAISYAHNAVYASYGDPDVAFDSCNIHDCRWAINLYTGTLPAKITHNTFTRCDYPVASARPVDTIANNDISYSGIAILLTAHALEPYIVNNRIGHCQQGINTQQGNHCIITGNIIYSCAGEGLKIWESYPGNTFKTLNLSGNSFCYNKVGMDISGLHGDIMHNTIAGNKTAIVCYDDNDSMNFRNNCIFDNTVNLDYRKPTNINSFAGNYWGSADSATIDAGIIDFYDNFVSGKVHFMPFMATPDANCNGADTSAHPTAVAAVNTPAAFKLYPNPATERLTIELPADGHAQISISNMTGAVIYRGEHNGGKQNIATANWPAGIYLVRCLGDGINETLKLEKQ